MAEKAKLEKYKKGAEAGDNEFSGFVNYAVTKKIEGKYKLARRLLVVAYILIDLLYASIFLVFTKMPTFVMFVPLLTWAMVYFTWCFVSIEYEYTIVGGVMTAREVFGMRWSRVICEVRVSAMEEIAPLDRIAASKLEKIPEESRFECISTKSSPDIYYALFDGKSLLFEATEKTLKVIKYYNSSVVIGKTRY